MERKKEARLAGEGAGVGRTCFIHLIEEVKAFVLQATLVKQSSELRDSFTESAFLNH